MRSRVLIADDDHNVRRALCLILEQAGYSVIGEASDSAAMHQQALAVLPDLLLVDWELAGLSGSEWVRQLHNRLPGMRIIALSARQEARQGALGSGVDAFISKCDPPEVVMSVLTKNHPGSHTSGPQGFYCTEQFRF